MKLYPLKTNPFPMQYIWGGTVIKEIFGKYTHLDTVAESWEVSCHKNGMATVANGEFENKTLKEMVDEFKGEILGNYVYEKFGGEFPLLIKFIDASDKLSVQVHPNNQYANEHENGQNGKTEMWYVIDAKPGASLTYGMSKDVTKEQFKDAIKQNVLNDILNQVNVEKGDAFYIPAGTIHAIGPGLFIAEIQQNSDLTYRVYDYNRRDKEGNLRPLHIEKSIEVTTLISAKGSEKIKPLVTQNEHFKTSTLVDNEFFYVAKIDLSSEMKRTTNKDSFEILVFLEGFGEIEYNELKIPFQKGDSFLIPACIGAYNICGKSTLLMSYLNKV